MEERTLHLETDHAWLQRTGALVVQRWKPGITLNLAIMHATMLVCHEFFGEEPYVLIMVVPEGTAFAMRFPDHDQYADTTADAPIRAMANVVEDEELRAVVALYYAQHPPAYQHAVFATMGQAEAWVRERVGE